MGAQRPGVLLLTGNTDLLGHVVAVRTHLDVANGAEQTVLHHQVFKDAVSHAVPAAGLCQGVWRVRHALHPAGDHDVMVARPDEQIGLLDGEHARAADAVDRLRRYRPCQTSAECRLPGRVLTCSALEHLAHHDVIDRARIDARPV